MDENQKGLKLDSPDDDQEDVNALMQFPEDPAVTVLRMYPVRATKERAAEPDPMTSAMDAIATLGKEMNRKVN